MKFSDPPLQNQFDFIFSMIEKKHRAGTATEAAIMQGNIQEMKKNFVAAVEAAIRREGEPCEWELREVTERENQLEYMTNGRWQIIRYNFCPMCGRALGGK